MAEKSPPNAEPAEPVEPAEPAEPAQPPQPAPRRNPVIRGLRAVRDCLGEKGAIGKITDSRVYWTLRDLRTLWLVLNPLLWWFEEHLGHYTVTNPIDRLMRESFNEPGIYGPVGKVMNTEFIAWLTEAMVVWFAVDTALHLLHRGLDKLVAEPYEIAQREYDEARRKLGDTSDDKDEGGRSPLEPLVTSRWFKYFTRAVIGWFAIQMVSDAGNAVYDIAQAEFDAMPEVTAAQLALINPYRFDLPPSQDGVIRDLLYFAEVLRDVTPTTLPDDDFDLYAGILRNLETRTDISWRTFEETEIRQPIMSAANRGGRGKPIPVEPFYLHSRFKMLYNHWHELAMQPGRPELWQEASDTTFLKPLVQSRVLGDQGSDAPDHESKANPNGAEYYRYQMSPEQAAEADQIYDLWRSQRDRKGAYLKLHPPSPMAWVPIPKSDIGRRGAWDSVLGGKEIGAGKTVSQSRLVGNKQWKPIFRGLNLEDVPWDIMKAEGKKNAQARLDATTASIDRRTQRRTKQDAYQLELGEKQRKEAIKQEKKQEL